MIGATPVAVVTADLGEESPAVEAAELTVPAAAAVPPAELEAVVAEAAGGATKSADEARVDGSPLAAPGGAEPGGLVVSVWASAVSVQSARTAIADAASLVRRWVEEKNEPMEDEVLVSEGPAKVR